MKISKIACTTIPYFPIEVFSQDNQRLRTNPFAVAEGDLDSSRIIATNQKATDAGLLLHMTVAQAHVVCPDLIVRTQDVEKEIEQSNRIYKKLQTISPFVEEAEVGLYYLDAAGLGLLYKNDQQFATRIIAMVKTTGYPVKVGVAKNKFVAKVAAEISATNNFSIIPNGKEKQFLTPLPIEHIRSNSLALQAETLATLHDLGLKTIGQLAVFPANEMIRRFGPLGAALSKLARGDDTAFFEPLSPAELLSDSVWLTEPLYRITMVTAQAEKLLLPLLKKLDRVSQGCCTVEIRFDLEDKSRHTFAISVEQPTHLVSTFIRQLRLRLQKLKLPSPITGLTVTIPTVTSLMAEQLSINRDFPTAEKGGSSLGDLSGCHGITVPVQHNVILPERRFSFSEPTQTKLKKNDDNARSQCLYALKEIAGLRLIQPPCEVEVITEYNQLRSVKRNKDHQPVITCLGPWKLSGEWWSQHFDRFYYEIQTAGKQIYLLFYDRLCSRWFMQGIFD